MTDLLRNKAHLSKLHSVRDSKTKGRRGSGGPSKPDFVPCRKVGRDNHGVCTYLPRPVSLNCQGAGSCSGSKLEPAGERTTLTFRHVRSEYIFMFAA